MSTPILGYATNCHSGESAAELIAAVRTEVGAVRRLLPPAEPLNLSLRISEKASWEFISTPALVDELITALNAADARVVSANAFPISPPFGGRYKDLIYSPDWRNRTRQRATVRIAQTLAALIDPGERGVLTTLTGACRTWPGCDSAEVEEQCARRLGNCAVELERLSAETGRELVLALEPEPCTTADSLPETIRYFKERLFRGPDEAVARRRLAVNLDLCHAAVMFEDPVENLRAYAREGIPVAGLHVSAALRLENPGANPAGLSALRRFDEPVYLHQVTAVDRSGQIAFRSPDLGEFLALPPERLAALSEARVHFHVPIFSTGFRASGLGPSKEGLSDSLAPETLAPDPQSLPLGTTASLIAPAVAEARAGNATNLFVVETYTWKLLEGTDGAAPTTAEGVAGELVAARGLLGN